MQNGDVLLTIVGSIGEAAIFNHRELITFQRSVAYLRPTVALESQFLYSLIQGYRFQKDLDKRKSTSAQPGIYLGDLSEIEVGFPKESNEQDRIGVFLKRLDSLISLHQRQSNFIKNILSILERRSLYGARK